MQSVTIAPPTPADRDEFLAAVARSRALHAEWVAPPSTPAAFDEYLRRAAEADFAAFLAHRVTDRALVGVVNVSQIVGEPLASAYLGFYAFEPHQQRGYMRAALAQVLQHAFGPLGLHRLEANIQPGNIASLALVKRCGFRYEGFSPRYLRIAGQWRDHQRWAILAEEFTAIDDRKCSGDV